MKHLISILYLFIYDSTLSKDTFDVVCNLIDYVRVALGICLIISKDNIQGTIDTCSLSNRLSVLEILNLITTMRSFCRDSSSSTTSWREDLQFNGNKSEVIIQTFLDFLFKIACRYHLSICLVEENTVIAHKVGYEAINKIKVRLMNVYLRNCYLNTAEYMKLITKFVHTSKLYIIDGQLTIDLCQTLLNKHFCFGVHELFLHSVTSVSTVTLTLHNQNASIVVITEDEIILHNPTSEQLALVLQLKPSVTKWNFQKCQLKPDVYYQTVTILTTNSVKTAELKIYLSDTDIGIVECDILAEHISNINTSVKHLDFSFTKLTLSMVSAIINIFVMWKVRRLTSVLSHTCVSI